jgi:signal transduction histidine kinase/CheY-like chemotaxis protein
MAGRYYKKKTAIQEYIILIFSAIILVWCGAVSALESVTHEAVNTFVIGTLILSSALFISGRAICVIYGLGIVTLIFCERHLRLEPINFLEEYIVLISAVVFGWLLSRILYMNRVDIFLNQKKVVEKNKLLTSEIATRKKAEKELTQIKKKLEQTVLDRTNELVQANEELRNEIAERKLTQEKLNQAQKLEAIGRLAGGIAHDFNNMLTTIIGNAEITLMDIPPDSSLTGNLQEIIKASHHSAVLTQQLLGFARKQTIIPKVLDLNYTIEGLIKVLRRLIGENIDLLWHPYPEVWSVKVDDSQISQIMTNLCANARDGIQGIGKITIETANVELDKNYCLNHVSCSPGQYVCISVADTGCGMNEETINSIFEPFFTTKDKEKGTGLGLATVYGIVQQNNGSIDVYSELGSGSEFKIYLPRYMEEARIEQESGTAEEKFSGNETILVAEDNPAILRVASSILESQGYYVLTAHTPLKAMDICKNFSGTIDLLLTDVIMPEMNGWQLAEEIIKQHPNLKILFMSGYSDEVIDHHGILEEGVLLLNKPFSKQEISKKVRNILDSVPLSRAESDFTSN